MTESKGALIQYGDTFLGPVPNLFVFQYNVEELDRQFNIQRRAEDNNVPARQLETHRALSAPVESFTLNIKLDATDDLDRGDDNRPALRRRTAIGRPGKDGEPRQQQRAAGRHRRCGGIAAWRRRQRADPLHPARDPAAN